MDHEYDFHSPLPHPGEILREDFMLPLGLTPSALARAMGLKDRSKIERLSRERQAVTADTALRLAAVFGTTPQFWANLQTNHDLSVAQIAAGPALKELTALVASPEG